MAKRKQTFAQFRAGITKQAEVLRRHGLLDPAEREHGHRRTKKVVEEPEEVDNLPITPDVEVE